jgi:hypothetical protein
MAAKDPVRRREAAAKANEVRWSKVNTPDARRAATAPMRAKSSEWREQNPDRVAEIQAEMLRGRQRLHAARQQFIFAVRASVKKARAVRSLDILLGELGEALAELDSQNKGAGR